MFSIFRGGDISKKAYYFRGLIVLREKLEIVPNWLPGTVIAIGYSQGYHTSLFLRFVLILKYYVFENINSPYF